MMPVPMVGRAGELAELVDTWSGLTTATRPMGRTAVITGAAGVGKSLLTATALDAFTPRPRTVLSGAARLHSPAPYDWLAAVLSGRDTTALPLPVDALAWLAQHPDPPRERYAPEALLRLAVRTVRELVGTGPAVLVVEDLHALDPASLNLIGELATVPDLPILLMVTSQPPEVAVSPALTARTMARLAGTAGAVRQHLDTLGRGEVADILTKVFPGHAVSATVVTAAWERTGGNPYRLTELLVARGGGGPKRLIHESTGTEPAGMERNRVEFTGAELTGREADVLACLAAGMSNKQVARSLGISVRTVTVHVSNLLRKTGSASRTEAALWAVRHRHAGSTPPTKSAFPRA
ncbi:response regulator transcription factor [Micromonospora polyrhachis]|uniref:DNA-binding CsgD family transcriptional regulator n=1 Tax=Micromonospora polyrhachis TaxID=1282883 RepID=A0A7W7WPW2_9ACTN|nr:LuxR family transcriptional regulator [Micromonospora polyrhachis]MBB4958653.1 DNA-binding CsgD family transcriptional regulator [Micromonospora polyrhachis]